jgi:hypothetical protein
MHGNSFLFFIAESDLSLVDGFMEPSFWANFITDNMMMISVVFIILSGFLAAFIQRRSKDACLIDFSKYFITLERLDGKKLWGTLRVEITGMEFTYKEKHADQNGHLESTQILYKFEYNQIQALVRFHDDLTDENKAKRTKELHRTYQPGLLKRWARKLKNALKTLKDACIEIVNLFIAQAKSGKGGSATVIAKQDKHVNKMKNELASAVGTSFEPILESYIGRKVIVDMYVDDEIFKYAGVLKGYTSDFLEVMDIAYPDRRVAENEIRTADLIIPRKLGIIRHLGE